MRNSQNLQGIRLIFEKKRIYHFYYAMGLKCNVVFFIFSHNIYIPKTYLNVVFCSDAQKTAQIKVSDTRRHTSSSTNDEKRNGILLLYPSFSFFQCQQQPVFEREVKWPLAQTCKRIEKLRSMTILRPNITLHSYYKGYVQVISNKMQFF